MEEEKCLKYYWSKIILITGIAFILTACMYINRKSKEQHAKENGNEPYKALSVKYQDSIYRMVLRSNDIVLKMKYPDEFFKFYKDKLIYPEARPNTAHMALAKLEDIGKLKAIVTQNIDGLHQAAGSKVVYELHGSVLRNYCMKCHEFYDEKFILASKGIPTCPKCGGKVKPDVVLYEEGLDEAIIQNSVKAISQADTLIIGGTSLVVYPAAGLINYFRGNNLVLINKSTTSADNKADLVIHDSIGKVLYEAVKSL